MRKLIKDSLSMTYLGFLLMLSIFWSSPAWSLDDYTERKIRLAVVQCEHALAVKPPRSQLALRVLQRYFKKYALYRDAAITRAPSVWDSDETHPTGERFLGKTYSEILPLCERELPKKLENAAQALLQYQAKQEAIAQQQAAAQQKAQQQALQQVKLAVGNYCQQYLRKPVPAMLDEAAEAQLNQDYAAYHNARRAALALSSDIQQAEFQATVKGAQAQQFLPKKQTVREWFDYCELVFAEHLSKTVEAEGPPVPAVEKQLVAEVKPQTPPEIDKKVTIDAEKNVEKRNIAKQDEAAEVKQEIADTAQQIEDSVEETEAELVEEAEPAIEEEAEAELPAEDAIETNDADIKDEEVDEEVDEEYLAAMKKAKGDRAKILKQEQRAPEYLDEDQEDILASKEWFFEDYDKNDNPTACRIYIFSANKLEEKEDFKGACFE